MNQLIFYGRISIDLQLYYSRTLSQELFKHMCIKNILRNVNTITAELRQTKMWNKNGRCKWNLKDMAKLEVFLWLTVKCYSEASRSSHRRCSIRTHFLQNTSRRLLLSFYKKILINAKNVRQTKVQKRFIYGEKKECKEQRETNSNASYCNWRPSSDW